MNVSSVQLDGFYRKDKNFYNCFIKLDRSIFLEDDHQFIQIKIDVKYRHVFRKLKKFKMKIGENKIAIIFK